MSIAKIHVDGNDFFSYDCAVSSKPFRVDKKEIEEDFTIENDELKVSFSGKTGMIMVSTHYLH